MASAQLRQRLRQETQTDSAATHFQQSRDLARNPARKALVSCIRVKTAWQHFYCFI